MFAEKKRRGNLISQSLCTYAYLPLVLVRSSVRVLIVLCDLVKRSSAQSLVDSHWVGPGSVSKQRAGKMAAPLYKVVSKQR